MHCSSGCRLHSAHVTLPLMIILMVCSHVTGLSSETLISRPFQLSSMRDMTSHKLRNTHIMGLYGCRLGEIRQLAARLYSILCCCCQDRPHRSRTTSLFTAVWRLPP